MVVIEAVSTLDEALEDKARSSKTIRHYYEQSIDGLDLEIGHIVLQTMGKTVGIRESKSIFERNLSYGMFTSLFDTFQSSGIGRETSANHRT